MAEPLELPPWAVGSYPGVAPPSWDGTARRVATGLAGFAADGLIPNAKTDAQSFNEWLARVQEWIVYAAATYGDAIFGDGSDGNLLVDSGTGDTNLTETGFYEDVTIDDGAFLHTDGYLLFVNGTLTITDGWVQWNGNPGDAGSVGGAAGAAHTATILAGGRAGGAGGNNANGMAGSSSATSLASASGRGGTGGNGGGVTLGAAGGSNARSIGDTRSVQAATTGHVLANGTHTAITGGAGGGGGGGGGAAGLFGGGGGGGGGVVIVIARNVVIVTGGIRANGGAGGAGENGGASAGGGGGGGGQGGVIYLVTRNLTNAGTIEAAGGAAGAASTGTPAGLVGTAGQAGYVISHLA